MKPLAKHPNTTHTQYMKYVLIVAISLMFVGCKKDRFVNTEARSWDSTPVALDSVPNDVIPPKLGNIGLLARVYGIPTTPTVWVKKHNDQEWVLIDGGLTQGNVTYIYDAVTHEVRFQGCNTTWAYAVYW